jgi:cytochrome c-type biogenesis protein CcmH
MKRRARYTAAVAALAFAAAAGAQQREVAPQGTAVADSILEARTSAVAATLRCPVCQGESIQDSPAELAQEMRSLVKDLLREGRTPDEIRAYFVGRYGEWILLEPAMTGLNVLLYLFPVALVVVGGAVVFMLIKRWSRPVPGPPDASVNADPPPT